MTSSGTCARLLVRPLVLGLGLAIAPTAFIGMTAPAQAEVQPCTVSYSTPVHALQPKPSAESHSWNPFDFPVTDTRVVTDVDFAVDYTHPDANISMHLLSPQTSAQTLQPTIQEFNGTSTTGAMNGLYVFDDEALLPPITGANPAPGRYRPATPATALDGQTASNSTGRWSIWILNRSTSTGTLRSLTLTLTFATCDSDGDGAEDQVDNCPGLANDQTNTDADGVGDACDLDDDGDGKADTDDGCPLAATTTTSGCPTTTRTAHVVYKKTKHRLAITVGSPVAGCRAGVEVTLLRKRKGADRRLVAITTNATGHYKMKAPKRGRFYVKAAASYAPGAAECGADTSPTIRIRR